MNIADPAAELKSRARTYGFQVFLQPERPSGWLVTVRPAGDALMQPFQTSAPTREDAIRAANRLFEEKLLDQLVRTLTDAGVEVPNWTPGIAWDDHVNALHATVREHNLRV